MNAWQRTRKKLQEKLCKDCPNQEVRDIFINIVENVSPSATQTLVGAQFYKDFNMFTVLGDGFPMARFVFSQDFKQVFFAFASDWRDNHKLQHMGSEVRIPYIFPVTDLKEHLKKIKI